MEAAEPCQTEAVIAGQTRPASRRTPGAFRGLKVDTKTDTNRLKVGWDCLGRFSLFSEENRAF
jgi:hypothetical protein